MTYGEYYYHVQDKMKLIRGIWISKPPNIRIPHKMNRKEASVYYAKKFKEYFEADLRFN